MTDIQLQLSQAQEAEQQKQWSQAIEAYKKVLEVTPDHKLALEKLAWCYSCGKQHGAAIEVLQELVKSQPAVAKWPYMIGYQYHEVQKYNVAIVWYDRALALKQDYIVVLYRKGYAHAQVIPTHVVLKDQYSDISKALQSFTRCREVWNSLPDGSAKQRDQGNCAKAAYHQAKLLIEYSKHPALKNSSAVESAISLLNESIGIDPDDHNKYYSLGKAYLANGEPEQALQAFQEADRLEPNQDYVLDKWAEALLQLHRLEESLAMYTRIPLKLRKDYILRNMGRLYYLSHANEKAIETLHLAVQKNRRNHNGHYYLGICFRDTGQLSLAIKELREAILLKQKHFSRPFPEAQAILDTLLAQASTLTNEQPDDGLQRGSVVEYKDRGYGFIETDDGEAYFSTSQTAWMKNALKLDAVLYLSKKRALRDQRQSGSRAFIVWKSSSK